MLRFLFFQLLCFAVISAQAQNFRLQIAASLDSIPAAEFKDRGVKSVIATVDQNGVHRYFVSSYATRAEAEAVQKQLIAKGFNGATIIDLEEQRVLQSELNCPWYHGGPIFEENDTVRIFLFDMGKTVLNDDARADLDYMLQLMKKYPDRELRILGFTDATGSGKANIEVASTRARTARNYLLDRGAPADKILLRVFGESASGQIEEDIDYQSDLEEARKRYRSVVMALVRLKK